MDADCGDKGIYGDHSASSLESTGEQVASRGDSINTGAAFGRAETGKSANPNDFYPELRSFDHARAVGRSDRTKRR